MLNLQSAHLLFLHSSEIKRDFLLSNQTHLDQLLTLINVLDDCNHLFVLSKGRISLLTGPCLGKIGLNLFQALHFQMTTKLLLRFDLAYQDLPHSQHFLIDRFNITKGDLYFSWIAWLDQSSNNKVPRTLICL